MVEHSLKITVNKKVPIRIVQKVVRTEQMPLWLKYAHWICMSLFEHSIEEYGCEQIGLHRVVCWGYWLVSLPVSYVPEICLYSIPKINRGSVALIGITTKVHVLYINYHHVSLMVE